MFSTGVPALGGDSRSHPESALYKTKEPQISDTEIQRLASFDQLRKQGYTRFSVAVWRSAVSADNGEYWVGIQFYWSSEAEFFDYHFISEPPRVFWFTARTYGVKQLPTS
jgi:hypothetical protein